MSLAMPLAPLDEAAARTTKVYIVDHDVLTRGSLALLLDGHGFTAVHYASADALLAELDALEPGCILTEICMSGMGRLALQHKLLERGCMFPLVVIAGHADVVPAVRAMKAGAADVVIKPVRAEDLRAAIDAAVAAARRAWDGNGAVQAARARIARLTRREREVLDGLVRGAPSKAIAFTLGISPRTVEIHRANVMGKLACRNLSDIVRLAMSAGVSLR